MIHGFFVLVLLTQVVAEPPNETLPDDPAEAAREISSESLEPQPAEDLRFFDETEILAPFRAAADSPVSFHDLDTAEIDRKHFGQEASSIIAETPSATWYSDSGSFAGYSYFRLRGIDQTRVNMTLDGVPLNEPEDQGVYFSNYPDFFSSVISAQVQRGVGTSSNGVASYAGSISFESPPLAGPPDLSAAAGYGSYDSTRISGEYASGVGNNFGLYVRASHLESDGYKYRSANQGSSVFYSAGWLGDRHLFKVTGFVGHQENELAWIGVPLEQVELDPRTNGNSDEDDQFTQSLTAFQYTTHLADGLTLSSSLYFNYLEGDYDFDLNNFLGLQSTDEMYNYAFDSRFLGGFANLSYSDRKLEVHGGIHANTYDRHHVGSEATIGQLYENTGFKDEISAFVKAGIRFGDFLLFGDLQARRTTFDYEGSVPFEKLEWNFLNPRFGLNYQWSAAVSSFFSAGRTDREPTRNDLFGGFDDLGTDENGDPLLFDIPPERVADYELGVRAAGRMWQVLTNLFYMDFEDEIVLNGQYGPNGLPLHSNVARSRRSGLEVDAWLGFASGLSFVNASSFSRNTITESDVHFEPVLSPEIIVNQEILYRWKGLGLSVAGRYQSSSWIDFGNTVELPAFLVFSAAVSQQIGRWELSLRGFNFTNQQYFTNGSIRFDGVPLYFVQSPRSFFVSARIQL